MLSRIAVTICLTPYSTQEFPFPPYPHQQLVLFNILKCNSCKVVLYILGLELTYISLLIEVEIFFIYLLASRVSTFMSLFITAQFSIGFPALFCQGRSLLYPNGWFLVCFWHFKHLFRGVSSINFIYTVLCWTNSFSPSIFHLTVCAF